MLIRYKSIGIAVAGWLIENFLFALWSPDGNRITYPPGPELIRDARIILYPLHDPIDFLTSAFIRNFIGDKHWVFWFQWDLVIFSDKMILVMLVSTIVYFMCLWIGFYIGKKTAYRLALARIDFRTYANPILANLFYVYYYALLLELLLACFHFWINPPFVSMQ